MRCKEECYIRQSAELLDLQKNILRIGFDSSTDFHAIFKGPFRKKLSCTICGEEPKNLRAGSRKIPRGMHFGPTSNTLFVIPSSSFLTGFRFVAATVRRIPHSSSFPGESTSAIVPSRSIHIELRRAFFTALFSQRTVR